MKSINANSFLLLSLVLLLFAGCHYRPENNMIKGNWKYVSILKGDSSFIEISDNDYIELHNDSSFYYTIKSVNKSMVGRWDYSDHTLHLHYQQPDTTRHFEIDVLTKYNLLFHEGDVQFKFIKMD